MTSSKSNKKRASPAGRGKCSPRRSNRRAKPANIKPTKHVSFDDEDSVSLVDQRVLSTDRHRSYLTLPAISPRDDSSGSGDFPATLKSAFKPLVSKKSITSSNSCPKIARFNDDFPNPLCQDRDDDEITALDSNNDLDMEPSASFSSPISTLENNFDYDFPSIPFLNIDAPSPTLSSFPLQSTNDKSTQFDPLYCQSPLDFPNNVGIGSALAAINEASLMAAQTDSGALELDLAQWPSPDSNKSSTNIFSVHAPMATSQFNNNLDLGLQTFMPSFGFGSGSQIFPQFFQFPQLDDMRVDPLLSSFASPNFMPTDFSLLDQD